MQNDIQTSSDAAIAKRRRAASILLQVADVGLLGWSATAAIAPNHLPGPGGAPILEVGYQRFTSSSWADLANASPKAAEFMTMLFRLYGAYGAAFSLLAIAIAATAFRRGERWAWWALLVGNAITFPVAMIYDRIVGAIGPFEILEYVGVATLVVAFALAAPRPMAPCRARATCAA